MAHIDPKAKKEVRFRVNLNHYQAAAVEALAALHRKQAASFLAEIIEAHLESYATENNNNINRCA
jgi:hypothetical protein